MLLKSGAAEVDGGAALKAGDSIGGDNIISRTPHQAAVRTTAATEVVSLDAEDYLAAMALGMSDDDDDYVVNVLGAYFDEPTTRRRRRRCDVRGRAVRAASPRLRRRAPPPPSPPVAAGPAAAARRRRCAGGHPPGRRRRAGRASPCPPATGPPGCSLAGTPVQQLEACPAGCTCAPPTAGRAGWPSTVWTRL